MMTENKNYFVHESSFIDDDVILEEGVKIWHFCHILSNTKIGLNTSIGQNCMIGPNVVVGSHCKIQNNVSLYDGLVVEDYVFLGPSSVFTNVTNPRSGVDRKNEFKQTFIRTGASIGANATIICGITLGRFCFVAAGAVVTKDVLPNALVAGVPAKQIGWVTDDGEILDDSLYSKNDGIHYCINSQGSLAKK